VRPGCATGARAVCGARVRCVKRACGVWGARAVCGARVRSVGRAWGAREECGALVWGRGRYLNDLLATRAIPAGDAALVQATPPHTLRDPPQST
jgi:hypothetical protein